MKTYIAFLWVDLELAPLFIPIRVEGVGQRVTPKIKCTSTYA